jgi:hypothetical protein
MNGVTMQGWIDADNELPGIRTLGFFAALFAECDIIID